MNYPVYNNKGSNEGTKKLGDRLERDGRTYNSAGEALEAYIAQFEGRRNNNYRRRPSDLLSPKPKYYFMDALERSLGGSANRSPTKKADELLHWVNHAYNKDLSSKVAAYGWPKTRSEGHKMRSHKEQSRYPDGGGGDDELSTLPSPSSSVVDLASNAGTVETEVLLSSFKGARPPGSYTRNVTFKSSSKYSASSFGRTSSAKSSSDYPSWVSSLGKEYPSWVEDLDSTALQSARQPAGSFQIEKTPGASSLSSASRKSPALKVADLHPRPSPSNSRSMRTNTPRRSPRARAISDDMLDSASIDTDVLLSQPIYGAEPVNMGGNLHKSLYEDKKVARLKKESTKKLRKSSSRTRQSRHKEKSPPSRTRSKDPGGVSPRVSRHLSYPSSYQDSSPLKPNDFYSSAEKQREARPPRYSLSPESHSHRMGGVSGRRSASPRLITEHQSPSVSRRPFFASSYRSIGSSTSTGQASGSPHKHFSPTTLRGSVPLQKAESDTESADTEREMRKSPTGIRMEKIYRDPSTMYPWKTMIQSSGSLYATGPGPSPHRVVMSPRAHDGRSRASYEGRYESPHWRSERPGRGQHVEDVMATPRPIFASSGHSGFPKSLPGYAKPPPAPESGQRRRTHRRSKTAPDLRRIPSQHSAAGGWGGWTARRPSTEDEIQSVDTELLVTHPPMPIVDVSPSLTTVSDSETMVDTESEADTEFPVPSRRVDGDRSSPPLFTTLFGTEKLSPTSVFASSNPRTAVTTELPKRFQLWKLDEDTTVQNGFVRQRAAGSKSNIISSFLEDCLSVDDDSERGKPSQVTRLSGKDAAPGPVEALKQMLFTMQDMAHHDPDQQLGDYSQPRTTSGTKRGNARDIDSDDESDRTSEILRGEVSLQRAYRHLERLKRLVGAEDERSAASSVT